jgi:hypothetical protein
MKRNIFVFGGMAGLVFLLFNLFLGWLNKNTPGHVGSVFVGYAAMVIAFSFIFVGVKNYRDKFNQGQVSFGKAFRVGLGITAVGSTLYVLIWLVNFYGFNPDFMDKYAAHQVEVIKASGVSQAVMDKKVAEINGMKEMYRNPLFVILMTYVEVLPVGLIISLLAALILKRRAPRGEVRLAA